MGSGIAQTMAHSGYYAILYDVDEAALSLAGERINSNLSHLVSKQIITEQDASDREARPFYLEALTLAEQNAASITDIDTLTEPVGFRMGPFRLMDLIGNDINCAVSQSLYEAFNKPDRLRPSSMQLQKVQSGELGKKTGKAYYDYPANS